MRLKLGRSEYSLFQVRSGSEVHYEDASRSRTPVRIGERDQGSIVEERWLCNDLGRVLAIARHFAELGELHPSARWVAWSTPYQALKQAGAAFRHLRSSATRFSWSDLHVVNIAGCSEIRRAATKGGGQLTRSWLPLEPILSVWF